MCQYRVGTSPRFGAVLILIAASLWGTSGLAASLLLRHAAVDGLAIGFYRLALSTPVLLLLSCRQWGRKVERQQGGRIVNLMLVGALLAGSHVSYFQAISYVGVCVATLVACSTMPVMVAFISWIGGLETMNRRTSSAMVLAILGVVLLLGIPESGPGLKSSYLGGGLALGASLFLALVTLVGKKAVVGRPPIFSAAMTTGAATLVLLPLVGYIGIPMSFRFEGWCLLLYLGLVPTALAYVLYFLGLKAVRATVASVLTLAEPLTAVMLANLLLGERLAWTGWLGAAMLLGAFLMMFRNH